MRKAITFTSTISAELASILNDYSQKLNTPKSQLIDIALRNYINILKREEYISSFKKAKNDFEMIALSEDGIYDYLELISR